MQAKPGRIEWLECQLAEVAAFIQRDTQQLEESPARHSIQLSLNSWLAHHIELTEELNALANNN